MSPSPVRRAPRPALPARPHARALAAAITTVAALLALPAAGVAAQPAANTAASSKHWVHVEHPYSRATPDGARNGGVFARAIVNDADRADRLVSAQSPLAATIELHRMVMDGDVARMRQVDAIDIPAHGRVVLGHEGDGLHLMLMDLKRPLKAGESIPVTLNFQNAGSIAVQVTVEPMLGGAAPHGRMK